VAKIPINFDMLLTNHPFHNQIRALLSEPLKSQVVNGNWSPCCIQVSYALNRAGAPIEDASFPSPEMRRAVRLFKSGSENCIIDVFDLRGYLDSRYGPAENHKGNKEQMIAAISGRKGIIRFGVTHVDLWEGDRYHQQFRKDLPDSGAWAVTEAGAWKAPGVDTVGVFFWQVG
jgi:hypothetical protein